MNIALRVANLVTKHGTADPYKIARYLNIKIISTTLPGSVRGFLVRVLRRRYIFINNALPEAAQQVALCHELGHARLHKGYGYYYHMDGIFFVRSKIEDEANEFAAHLLSYCSEIDPTHFKAYCINTRPSADVIHHILKELIGG
jgi:Zn-dependent peptidase ImmA (M78 family)